MRGGGADGLRGWQAHLMKPAQRRNSQRSTSRSLRLTRANRGGSGQATSIRSARRSMCRGRGRQGTCLIQLCGDAAKGTPSDVMCGPDVSRWSVASGFQERGTCAMRSGVLSLSIGPGGATRRSRGGERLPATSREDPGLLRVPPFHEQANSGTDGPPRILSRIF